MSEDVEQVDFDQLSATTAWDKLISEYAAAGAHADLDPHWVELIRTVAGVDAELVEEQVHGNVPQPIAPRPADDVVVEVMSGVSDVVVRLCADVVLYGEDTAEELVAAARGINDRYCDLLDLVAGRHPDVDFGGQADQEREPVSTGTPAAPSSDDGSDGSAASAVANESATGAPWQHRTGTPIDSQALGGLVKRLVTAYAAQADVATLEAMWRSAFGAASGCDAAVVQEVCEAARLPEQELSEARAANEVAAGFEELFAAAVVRLFAPESSGDGDLADEGRRLVQRRDALFDLIEELYPGMYDDSDDEAETEEE